MISHHLLHSEVSTHSRLKAAGKAVKTFIAAQESFNTQPPEGGWLINFQTVFDTDCFNTQPPEGGWIRYSKLKNNT